MLRDILFIHDRYCLANDITSIIDRHLQMHKPYIDVIWVLAYEVGLVNVSRGIYNSLILCSIDDWGLVLRMCQERVRETERGKERERKTEGMKSKVNPLWYNITCTNEWAHWLSRSLSLRFLEAWRDFFNQGDQRDLWMSTTLHSHVHCVWMILWLGLFCV